MELKLSGSLPPVFELYDIDERLVVYVPFEVDDSCWILLIGVGIGKYLAGIIILVFSVLLRIWFGFHKIDSLLTLD
jgi:hypothetical protein